MTPTATPPVATVVGWNDATNAHGRLTTVVVGSTLPVTGRVCTEPRKRRSRLTACLNKVAHLQYCGGHYRPCSAAIETYPAPPVIRPTDSRRFFREKVEDVQASTADLPPPSVHGIALSSLSSCRLCTESEVRRVIMKSPSKSCSLDPLPSYVVTVHHEYG